MLLPAGRLSAKFPSRSEVTAGGDPVSTILAPGTGAPVSSLTVPERVDCWGAMRSFSFGVTGLFASEALGLARRLQTSNTPKTTENVVFRFLLKIFFTRVKNRNLLSIIFKVLLVNNLLKLE